MNTKLLAAGVGVGLGLISSAAMMVHAATAATAPSKTITITLDANGNVTSFQVGAGAGGTPPPTDQDKVPIACLNPPFPNQCCYRYLDPQGNAFQVLRWDPSPPTPLTRNPSSLCTQIP